jgi:large subunit ribosomal protein L4
MPIEEGNILMILDKINPEIELSAANIPYVKVINVGGINILDLVSHDYIVVTKDAISKIKETYTTNDSKR